MIEGVHVKPLTEFHNEQGGVQHMLRCDDPEFFVGFGEIYFSLVNPGVIKGWHCHRRQTSALSCVAGLVRLVVHVEGQTEDLLIGDGHRCLVKISPGVWYAWQNIGAQPAILANCASLPHDPSEGEKRGIESIPFRWA